MIVAGETVVLRPLEADDVDALVRSAESAEGRIGGRHSREELLLRVESSGRFVGGKLDLAVEVDGRFAGTIQARSPEQFMPPGICELGIVLLPETRGRGVGTEACRLLSRHLLETGFARVQASTDVENVAMRRALERAGFEFEGVMRAFMPEGAGRVDYALYALTSG